MTDPATTVLERARELTEDLRLGAVKDWKARNPKGLAIGYLPVYVPRPLFEAIGCLPVAVFGGGDQIDVVRGDSFFQSYICHLPRSTVEMALAGNLDALDGMVFPSTCDVIRNLSGMWRMLFPKKYTAYLDLPQDFDAELGGQFYGLEMRRVAAELAERGALPLEEKSLRAAIAREDRRRKLLLDLAAIRRDEPWRIRASEAYVAVRAGGALTAEAHAELLEEILAAVRTRSGHPYDNIRVIAVGSFCEQPPLGLIRTLEQSGCDLVLDDFQLGLSYIDGPIALEAGDDPIDALARAFTDRGAPTACRYIGDAQKGVALVETVKRIRADGVVFLAASFCDPALLDQPMLERALDEANVPHTSVKFAENTGQFKTVREQAGAFSDSLKLWGAA